MDARTSDLTLSRRQLMTGAAAAGAAALALPARLVAQGAPHTFKVGAAEVTIFSDGALAAPWTAALPDRTPADVAAAGQSSPELRLQYNVSLVKLGGETVLIDTGSGPDFAPMRGKLHENLARAGIKPEAITRVVFTHAHPDHLWGVVDPFDGSSVFTKARHQMPAAERDYWLKPGIETSVPESARGTAAGTQRRLKELGEKIETVKLGAEVLPGLSIVDSSGHTPGHACVLLSSGSDRLMVIGDALTDAVISFARPEWRWAPDLDQDKAIASRLKLLDMLAHEKTPIVGYHLPWPGVGRVERVAGAARTFRFVPG